MTHTIKPFAAAAIALTMTSSAFAQNFVQTAFEYDAASSAEVNYQSIRDTAEKSCKAQHPRRTTSYTSAYNRLMKNCLSNMIDAAIEAIDDPVLTALHDGSEVKLQVLAAKD